MKSVYKISVFILLLGLMSCKGSFYNQKFTNLRHIKPKKEKVLAQDDKALLDQDDQVLDNSSKEIDDVQPEIVLQEKDPKRVFIEDAIENEIPLYVRMKGKTYRVQNPVYDSFYEGLIGRLEESDVSNIDGTFAIVNASESNERLGKHTISLDKITNTEVITPKEKVKTNEPPVEDKSSKVEKLEEKRDFTSWRGKDWRAERKKQKSYAQETSVDFRKTRNGKKFHNWFTAAWVVLIAAAFLSVIGLFVSWVLLFGAIIGGLLLMYICFLAALGYGLKYRNELLIRKRRFSNKNNGKMTAIWFMLVIMSIFGAFLPLILVALIAGTNNNSI